ncbi:MAG TPA: hypothetical protein VN850_11345, partial [Candidatus Acidoferrales bacterium]|nr:hypothetical protein [Candidatus Acidoferrales bacterium]
LTQLCAVIFLMSFSPFVPLVLPLQSRHAQNPAPGDIVCGTINTQFTEGRCIHITFSGEASANKNFDRPFGPLRFRLNSEEALSGWWIEVVPAEDANSGNDEYVWAVTPPYHFGNVRYLDTSYGARAEDSVKESPRDFNFVLNQQQFHRAADLVDLAVSSHLVSEHKSEAEFDRESQDAIAALESLPIGKGRLQILDSHVNRSAGQDGLGTIEWLKFQVELHVPCNFTVSDSAGLSIDRSQCSSESKNH